MQWKVNQPVTHEDIAVEDFSDYSGWTNAGDGWTISRHTAFKVGRIAIIALTAIWTDLKGKDIATIKLPDALIPLR